MDGHGTSSLGLGPVAVDFRALSMRIFYVYSHVGLDRAAWPLGSLMAGHYMEF